MRLIWIIVFFVLIQSSSSFGNPNGKGVLCECIECRFDTKVTGYLFEWDHITDYVFLLNNDEISIERGSTYEYRTNSNTIHWINENKYDYELNRKDLILTYYFKTISDGDLLKVGSETRQCKIYSKHEFLKTLEKIQPIYQGIVNKSLKGNKL